MSGLWLLNAGLQSVLQDGGRWGWQHLGVAPSGFLDRHAACWANRLLGNPWDAPLVEIALGNLQARAEQAMQLALTGADVELCINGRRQLPWSSFFLKPGDELSLGGARHGLRSYLAVQGGWQVVSCLGSCATSMREGLGGLQGCGQALKAGELLPCSAGVRQPARSVPWRYQRRYSNKAQLRVLVGGDAVSFEPEQLAAFFERSWQLSPEANRQGVRLQGELLRVPRKEWSQGMASGAIQVPPDGLPIILQRERQCLGGYPVLGWLHPLDLDRLAQLPPYSSVRFTAVSLADAQHELRAFYQFFNEP